MPRKIHVWVFLVVIIVALQLASCAQAPAEAVSKEPPARVEDVEGTEFNRITLTERAAQRLGIETDAVREMEVAGTDALVVPYAAVLYGLNGETWLYVNPEPLTYVRQPITIDRIEGELAILLDDPAPGTAVVTVGVAQLFGADTGVGK